MLDRIAVNRLVLSTMHAQVCLPVAVEIELAQRNPASDRFFINSRRHRPPMPHDITRQSDIQRNNLHGVHPSSATEVIPRSAGLPPPGTRPDSKPITTRPAK